MKTKPVLQLLLILLLWNEVVACSLVTTVTPTRTSTIHPDTLSSSDESVSTPTITKNPTHTITNTDNASAATTNTVVKTYPTPTTSKEALTPTETKDSMLRMTLNAHDQAISAQAFSPDGQTLASAANDGTIRIWQLSDGTLKQTLTENIDFTVETLQFSLSGENLASSGGGMIMLWQVDDGALLGKYNSEGESMIHQLFTPEGKLAISGIVDENRVNLTWLPSGKQTNFISQNPDVLIKSAKLSPDGKIFALGRSNGTVELYEASDGKLLRTIDAHADWVMNLAFSPNSQLLATDSVSFDPTVKVWQVSNGELIQTLEENKWDFGMLYFSPGGDFLISMSPAMTKVWQTTNWLLYREVFTYGLFFSPNDTLFFEAGEDHTINIWQVSDGALLQTFSMESFKCLNFSPTEAMLALGKEDGSIQLREIHPSNTMPEKFLATPKPGGASDEEIFAAIEEAYVDMVDENEYIDWDNNLKTLFIIGVSGRELIFDPLPIQTQEGILLGHAVATVKLYNLHDGKHNTLLVPLAIELPDGLLFMPGLGDPVPQEQKEEFLQSLQAENLPGRSIIVLAAPELLPAREAMDMPEIPWQDNLIITYQASWTTEMTEMFSSGQSIEVDGQKLLLLPLALWFDTFPPVSLP